MDRIIDFLGAAAAVIMPMFNIPLILRIVKRKSSEDISIVWVLGVWVCIMLMFPSGLKTDDMVFKLFNWVNVIMFTGVMLVVVKYRKKTS